jgi:hypothetical protein
MMTELKQCDIQMPVKVAVRKLLMAYCAVLVLMRLRSIVSIVRGLGDMWCLKCRRKNREERC